jgi:RNA polymerase sigma factor (sigma-70 family)
MTFNNNSKKDEDMHLWVSFLSGDNNSYKLLYQKYAKSLFRQGMQYTKDRELIMDCIHDVFLKIYENRNKQIQIHNIKIYLFISLRNRLFDLLKKKNITFEDTNYSSDIEYESTIESLNPEEELIEKETININDELIKKALTQLTPRQKEIFMYRFVEEISINDISLIMSMNYQSVQNLIQRGLKKIKDFLKKTKEN